LSWQAAEENYNAAAMKRKVKKALVFDAGCARLPIIGFFYRLLRL
jgi:hypothetical protein